MKKIFTGIIAFNFFFVLLMIHSEFTVNAAGSIFSKPIGINSSAFSASSYRGLGPFILRGMMLNSVNSNVYSQLENAKNAGGSEIVDLTLGIGSISFLNQLDTARLRNIGVTTISYNPEGGHTPSDEFNQRRVDSDSNPIVQFGRWGEQNSFNTVWAPLRGDSDSTPDSVIQRIYDAGIDGLGLQEQRFIETACPNDRYNKVKNTIEKHERLAGKNLFVSVQIMAIRCQTAEQLSCSESYSSSYGHCDTFVDLIAGLVDTIGFWPSTGDLDIIPILRSGSALPTDTPTPSSSPVLGDANNDGKVDELDYTIWLNNYNTQTNNGPFDGDFDRNRAVDGPDYVIWLNSYNT